MQPKITIIIPVYNVEPYLRQCLDSVVGQTLQEIQILCVDHSSTDGSLAILEEFAAKDPRIEIIHCENTGGGPGQARNAGFAHVKGKYLYFVDSDDSLDLTLCEKAYYRLEQSSSDILFFYPHEIAEAGQEDRKYWGNVDKWHIKSDALNYLDFPVPPWNRVTRTAYLESIGLRFPEGKLSEDQFFHWISLVHQPRVIFLPQRLYYRLYRPDSEMGQRGEYVANHALVYSMIKQYLMDIGKYQTLRGKLLARKFGSAFWAYNYVFPAHQYKVKHSVLKTIDDDEIAFIKEGKHIHGAARDFYLDLLGLQPKPVAAPPPPPPPPPTFRQKLKQINRQVFRPLEKLFKKANRAVMRPLENLVRFLRGKPLKKLQPAPAKLENLTFRQRLKKTNRNVMRPVEQFVKKANRTIMRPLENLVRLLRGKPMKTAAPSVLPTAPAVTAAPPSQAETNADRQIRDLSELVCQLSKEVVELRELLVRNGQSDNDSVTKRAA